MQQVTREEWLQRANDIMRVELFKPAGYDLPEDVQITVGYPLGYRSSSKMQTVGQCFPRKASSAGVNEVILNIKLGSTSEDKKEIRENTETVLDILVHEDSHAIDDCQHGHGPEFREIATSVGLCGPMRSTKATDELKQFFIDKVISEIGEFPHRALTANRKKQSTRMLKVACSHECGFQFYTSRKQLNDINYVECHGCGELGLIVHANGEQYQI